jgi:hypothetical protein
LRTYLRADGATWRTVEFDKGECIPPLDEFDALWVMTVRLSTKCDTRAETPRRAGTRSQNIGALELVVIEQPAQFAAFDGRRHVPFRPESNTQARSSPLTNDLAVIARKRRGYPERLPSPGRHVPIFVAPKRHVLFVFTDGQACMLRQFSWIQRRSVSPKIPRAGANPACIVREKMSDPRGVADCSDMDHDVGVHVAIPRRFREIQRRTHLRVIANKRRHDRGDVDSAEAERRDDS